MHHNKQRLLSIEKWARRLSWWYLAAVILGTLQATYYGYMVLAQPAQLGLIGPSNSAVWKSQIITGNLWSVLGAALAFFLLQGVAKTIRYLLALRREIQTGYRRRKISPNLPGK